MPPSIQGNASISASADRPKPLGLILDQSKADQPIRVKQVVVGGSAAENGGVQVGDELIRVDGRTVTELDVAGVTELIFDPSSRNRWSSTPDRTVKPTGVSSTTEKKNKGQPCGIGMTVMDEPPHVVTYLTPNGPAHRSHAIQVGDCLVAIDKELVADIEMEEVVQRVIGEEGTDVDVWLERVPKGGQSYAHHEKGEEIRGQLARLASLHQDGLLDKRTWRTEMEKCWKGCYSVRLTRGVAYSGEHQYQQDASKPRTAEPASPDPAAVTLTLYRPAARRELQVVLPRPLRAETATEKAQAAERPAAGAVEPKAQQREEPQPRAGGDVAKAEGGDSVVQSLYRKPPPQQEAAGGAWGQEQQRPLPVRPGGGLTVETEAVAVVAFVGDAGRIGLGLARSGNRVLVTEVAPDGAAATSGCIQKGDELVAVDDQMVGGQDVSVACGALTGGPDRHVTLTLVRHPTRGTGKARGQGQDKVQVQVGGPAEGSFKVVLPRPERAGSACSCPVCATMMGGGGPAGGTGSLAGTPSSTVRRSWRGSQPTGTQDSSGPAESPKELNLNLNPVEHVGNMLTGLFSLFKSPPSTPTRENPSQAPANNFNSTSSVAATKRKEEEERKRRQQERQAAVEAAEKLKDFVKVWQGHGHLCCSDDTDSLLHDSRWRVMIDVEDEDDWKWLYSHHREQQSMA